MFTGHICIYPAHLTALFCRWSKSHHWKEDSSLKQTSLLLSLAFLVFIHAKGAGEVNFSPVLRDEYPPKTYINA